MSRVSRVRARACLIELSLVTCLPSSKLVCVCSPVFVTVSSVRQLTYWWQRKLCVDIIVSREMNNVGR